ncbi:MAG: MFS transporter, partial [Deltaproteobacteria bacterium]|nr:MFS transporter [Deltaproteobacteria bacterium]
MDARRYVLITVLLGGMGQGVVAPKLPELLSGNAQLFLASGAAASLMYLGIFVSTQRFGRAADAGRAHLLVRWGLVAYALSLVALGCFRSTGAVFATRFVEGLALSAVYVAADFILGRLSKPRERAQWLSYYGVALSIGLALGPLAALALARVSPKPLFVLGAVAALALTLAAFAGRARVGRLPSSESTKLKLGLGPLSTGAVYGFMEAGLVAVFPVLAVRE